MSTVQTLKTFIQQRLAVAVDEILGLLETTLSSHEEEMSRQRRLLETTASTHEEEQSRREQRSELAMSTTGSQQVIRFRVIIDHDIRKITFQHGVPSSVEDLIKALQRMFPIPTRVGLQYRDQDFDDFFTLTSTRDLKDKDTLKVVNLPPAIILTMVSEEPKPNTMTTVHQEHKPSMTPVYQEHKPNMSPVYQEHKPNMNPVYQEHKPNMTPINQEHKPNMNPCYQDHKPNMNPIHKEHKPNMTPVYQEHKPNMTLIHQEHKPNMTPVYEDHKPNLNPVYQEHKPNMNPCYQDHKPVMNPVYQDHQPNTNPVYQEYKPNMNPVYQDHKPNMNPAYQDHQPNMNPVYQEHKSNITPVYQDFKLSKMTMTHQDTKSNVMSTAHLEPNMVTTIHQETKPNIMTTVHQDPNTMNTDQQETKPNIMTVVHQEPITNFMTTVNQETKPIVTTVHLESQPDTSDASSVDDLPFVDSEPQDNAIPSPPVRERQNLWPSVFPIPTFSYNTEMILRQSNERFLKDGIPLTSPGVKSDILERLAEAMFSYTAYPNEPQRAAVAQALIEKHPCLREPGSFNGCYGWQQSLRYKCANYRSKLKAHGNPELLINTLKHKQEGDRTPAKNIKKPRKCEVNYLPPHPAGETDHSLEMVRLQLIEAIKSEDSGHMVCEMMSRTYSYRRREVVGQSMPVAELIERWPALFDPVQINEEFRRCNTIPLESIFTTQLDRYTPKLLELFSSKGGAVGLRIKSVLIELIQDPGASVVKRRDVTLRCLIEYMGESVQELISDYYRTTEEEVHQELRAESLRIYVCHQPSAVGIVMDGRPVLTGLDNLSRACCLLLGLTYALNLDYPPKLVRTFEVFQRLFVGLDMLQPKPSSKFINLKNKLLT